MDFLKDPYSLFDIHGKVALASKTLAGAGSKLVLSAGNKDALTAVGAECQALGAEVTLVDDRPDNEKSCDLGHGPGRSRYLLHARHSGREPAHPERPDNTRQEVQPNNSDG
ncbi:hypothetical protein [Candidatus Halocynthiibacter alkanivorans]|uniref:hypothetical protein n=1 Tax=Candidatus Halocynthiibacter alkanivorans TaxID=2267619 RepID=UPI000DF3FF6A|nr:hypothetical protein [Candidatus Halocynthiibacter alkanivorans]